MYLSHNVGWCDAELAGECLRAGSAAAGRRVVERGADSPSAGSVSAIVSMSQRPASMNRPCTSRPSSGTDSSSSSQLINSCHRDTNTSFHSRTPAARANSQVNTTNNRAASYTYIGENGVIWPFFK